MLPNTEVAADVEGCEQWRLPGPHRLDQSSDEEAFECLCEAFRDMRLTETEVFVLVIKYFLFLDLPKIYDSNQLLTFLSFWDDNFLFNLTSRGSVSRF